MKFSFFSRAVGPDFLMGFALIIPPGLLGILFWLMA